MNDKNGKEIRPGQRVRVTFEGVLDGHEDGLWMDGPNGGPGIRVTRRDGAPTRPWGQVEVLAEPQIPEPKGLGAVVESARHPGGPRLRFTRADDGESPFGWWGRGYGWTRWDDLVDPVLLSEGWTDGDDF